MPGPKPKGVLSGSEGQFSQAEGSWLLSLLVWLAAPPLPHQSLLGQCVQAWGLKAHSQQ